MTANADTGPGDPGWSLADKINYLFDTIRRPDGKPYSNDEVAAAMEARGNGLTVSGAYLSLLRRGRRDNPTKRHLEALSAFFTVDAAYFFDNTASLQIADEIALLRSLADAGVQRIATRLGGLSAESLRDLASIVERIRASEGLDSQKSDS